MITKSKQRATLPAELKPENICIIVDTREQHPWDLTPLQTVIGTLPTADYTIAGLESICALERKNLNDLLSCIGVERERFTRELQRLAAYPCKCLIIEASWQQIEQGGWRSKVTPESALGSLLGWIAQGIPIIMAGDRQRAEKYAARFLFTVARRRWREARTLVGNGLKEEATA